MTAIVTAPTAVPPEAANAQREWGATRYLAIFAAGALALSSAGFGAVFAWTTVAAHGPVLAGFAVVMALGLEAAKPLAMAGVLTSLRRWHIGQGLTLAMLAAVAVTYSLTAELQLWARSRTDAVEARAAGTEDTREARAKVNALRSEFASIAPARPSAEVQPLIEAALSDKKLEGCEARWLETLKAREGCIAVNSLRAEIARAERRADLVERIEAAERELRRERKADPGAVALASLLSALGWQVSADAVANWLVLVAVLALETGSLFSVILVQAVAGTPMRASVQPRSAAPAPITPVLPAITGPAPGAQGVHAPAAVLHVPEDPRERLLQMLRDHGGEVRGGQRMMARALGISAGAVNTLLRTMATAGTVVVSTDRSGTIVRLLA